VVVVVVVAVVVVGKGAGFFLHWFPTLSPRLPYPCGRRKRSGQQRSSAASGQRSAYLMAWRGLPGARR